ncbi:MAG: GDP-L-fucose synthase [Pyrinomonadaceae bacterium]
MEKNSKIYIAGATGMIGGAIKRNLETAGYSNLVHPKSQEVDLIDQHAVYQFFARERPEVVVLAAGMVGGILANNTRRAEFIFKNLLIESNVIHASKEQSVKKLIFLGSSCIYPKLASQPIREEELLSGPLEPTNEPYAIAKIAGIKLCENYYRQYGCNFFSVMPTNIYGVNDNFDLQSSHVVPALIRKIHEAKARGSSTVVLWGTGSPRREFLYVDDLADALVFLLNSIKAEDVYQQGVSHINIGTGEDIEIKTLAETISDIVGFEGELEFDSQYPDGTPRKLLDVSRINRMGWNHSTTLADGLKRTYKWYCSRLQEETL